MVADGLIIADRPSRVFRERLRRLVFRLRLITGAFGYSPARSPKLI